MEAPKKPYRVLLRNNTTNKWEGPHWLPLSEIDFRAGIEKGHFKIPHDKKWVAGLIKDNGLAVFTAVAAFLAAIASIIAAIAALAD